ncbi:MAG: aminotransferase class III-fold pyridoxal phosphate-dependent enzyme, partial [Chloroflexi bacterium]|nr:aminotransferase class III-fold pyridoxal phosphate-dependent enzyme [Chloroflexota bacterium]
MDRGSGVSVNRVELSLSDLLGKSHTDAVCEACAFVQGVDSRELVALADEKVDFFPQSFQQRMDDLLNHVGEQVCDGLPTSAAGAGSAAFVGATDTRKSPLTGLGFIRIGEDGRAYLAAKSEHYHLSIGHSFPGYRLLQHAEKLGIPNATHNNTRGHATRLVEQELVRVVNGIPKGDRERLSQVISTQEPHVLNRVLNLETGSLVVEAALKMMLARFYRLDAVSDTPVYQGRVPVILVLADHGGGKSANYHGTTTLTQVLRGMWPDLYEKLESSQTMIVEPVQINDIRDFERAVLKYDAGRYKVAGFFHEIVLMNYGAIKLDAEYLRQAHTICRERDIPIMVDEIQSCVWAPDLFLFREYGLQPDLVSIGKGFPG